MKDSPQEFLVKQIVSNTRNWVPEVRRTVESLDERNGEVKRIG